MPSNYHPELDTSPSLDDDKIRLYQSYVGILRWTVELGRIDISLPTSLMATYMACPHADHMRKLLMIFGYLKMHLNTRLVFDPKVRNWNHIPWVSADWSEFYPDACEVIPDNMPESRGNEVQLNVFVDAAHATDIVTRISVTGILIYLNGAPIRWYSKRQNTIEPSTFGSEFVAMKIAVEIIEGIRYKLRMMGIPLEGSANVFGDNDSVVKNATKPESTLKKKHNSVAYHKVRESAAAGAVRIAHEPGVKNVADMLTKILGAQKMKKCAQCCLF